MGNILPHEPEILNILAVIDILFRHIQHRVVFLVCLAEGYFQRGQLLQDQEPLQRWHVSCCEVHQQAKMVSDKLPHSHEVPFEKKKHVHS